MKFEGFVDFVKKPYFSGGDIIVSGSTAYLLINDECTVVDRCLTKGFSLVRLGDVPNDCNMWTGIVDRFPRCTAQGIVEQTLNTVFGKDKWKHVPRAYIKIVVEQQ